MANLLKSKQIYPGANDEVLVTSGGTAIWAPISGITVQELNDLSDVTTGMPALSAQTAADDGKLLHYDFDTQQWVTDDSVNHGTVVINGKKGSAGTIARGLPVYLTGFDNDLHQVELANASSSATMPVIGFTAEILNDTDIRHIITFGKIQNVDLTTANTTLNPNAETWAVNDSLYISTTTGGLTKVRPTGAATLIQRIAKVLKTGTTGQFFVFNTARSAGLPNLTQDNIWIGNSDNQPIEAGINSFGFTTGSGTTNFVSKWQNTTGLTDSQIYDDGTAVSINTTSPEAGFRLFVSGDTKVTGHFEADSKSFDIQHPSDPNKRLRYGSLEGPEFGVYHRGKSTTQKIELPYYWKDLVDENTITVQITPFGKQQNLYVGEVSSSEIEVLGDDSPQYFYNVYAERKDIDKITVEY